MTTPSKRLVSLQEQLQRFWERIEAERDRGIQAMMWERYRGLEAHETEIRSERGYLGKDP